MPFDVAPQRSYKDKIRDNDVAVLRQAMELLDRGWCRGTFARNGAGSDVDPLSEAALTFCAIGAVRRAMGSRMFKGCRYRRMISLLNRASFSGQIIRTNDSGTKAGVLAAFKRAIHARINGITLERGKPIQ